MVGTAQEGAEWVNSRLVGVEKFMTVLNGNFMTVRQSRQCFPFSYVTICLI